MPINGSNSILFLPMAERPTGGGVEVCGRFGYATGQVVTDGL
jgi:hypothetical protein